MFFQSFKVSNELPKSAFFEIFFGITMFLLINAFEAYVNFDFNSQKLTFFQILELAAPYVRSKNDKELVELILKFQLIPCIAK